MGSKVEGRAPRLMYIVTDWSAADWHLRGQLDAMRRRGFEVTLVASGPPDALHELGEREGVRVRGVPMEREIAPIKDLRALALLAREIASWRPDVVNASTPKGGLLGTIAARALGVPVRVYVLRGLRLETCAGPKRAILWGCEQITAACASDVVVVGRGLRARAAELGLSAGRRGVVLGGGSSNGVEIERFRPSELLLARAAARRRALGIPERARVIGFVGRMTRDKGIAELWQAFERLAADRPDVHLLLVGNFEAGDPVGASIRKACAAHERVHAPGFVADPESYYPLMDVFAFPSHREGLPNAPLQAAACGVPAVGFRATGTTDVVRDGETGALVEVGDAAALGRALASYLDDPERRRAHGERAAAWVGDAFGREAIWNELEALYQRRLEAQSA